MEKLKLLKNKVERILTNELGGETLFEIDDSEDRLWGNVISPAFEPFDHFDRQSRLWKVLRQHLSSAEQRKIRALFCSTPEEWEFITEEREASRT